MSIRTLVRDYLFGWLLPTHVTTGESVQFSKESSIREDMAILYVSVRAPKDVIARIEVLMKSGIYSSLAAETCREGSRSSCDDQVQLRAVQ